jgi:predicted RNase H-like nuclease (RuvC/YqgF family)
MIRQRQLFNKGLMIAEVEKNFNKLLDTISKQDNEIEELERKLKLCEKNKIELARAYCKKLGIIKTKKEVIEYFENRDKDPLDIIFVRKHDALHEDNAKKLKGGC